MKKKDEVLALKHKDNYSVKQICHRLKMSKWAVYKTLQRDGKMSKMSNGGGPPSPEGIENKSEKEDLSIQRSQNRMDKYWRLHGLQFDIRIFWASEAYKGLKEPGFSFSYGGCSVVGYRRKVEVYSSLEFKGDSPSSVFGLATAFFWPYFERLGRKLHITILKEGVPNIQIVAAHYAEVDNEIAKDYDLRGEKLRVLAEDGKVAFLYDRSVSPFVELEAIHPETAKVDADKVDYFLKDLRRAEMVSLSEIKEVVFDLAMSQKVSVEILQTMSLMLKAIISPEKEGDEKVNKEDKVSYIG